MVVPEKQIDELDQFFKKATLPPTVQLDEGSKIISVKKFIESHLSVLRNNPDSQLFKAFYSRLLRLKEIILIKP